MEMPTRTVCLGSLDLTEVIDRTRFGAFGLGVVALCAMAMVLDGFDIQVITFVAPALVKAFGVDRSVLGPVFSSGLIGTTLGALVLGPLGDRVGRKPMLCGCILAFALCSLGTITATGIGSLIAWRLLSGLALGGTAPIAVALSAEFCPARVRGTATIIVACGHPVGAAIGGFLVAQLVPAYGWQSAFLLGGLAPLALAAVMVVLLPRSIGDLARHGRSEDLARTIRRIAPDASADPRAEIRLARSERGFPIGRLFAEHRAPRTIVLWIMFFTNILSLYFMVSWLPTLAHASGLELSDAVRIAAFSQVGSILGTLSLAALVRRLDPFMVIGLGYLCGVASLVLMAFSGGALAAFSVAAFLAGFFVIGFQTGANAVSALVYPDGLRSTGVGWALGIGRIGAILGPSLGGVLIGLGWPTRDLFIAACGPTVLAALSAFALARMLRRPAGPRAPVHAADETRQASRHGFGAASNIQPQSGE